MKELKDVLLKKTFETVLNDNIEQCLYLTIDLETYDLDDPNVTFYYDYEDNILNALIMKYYDSVQMYVDMGVTEIRKYVDFVKKLSPIAICSRKAVIEEMEQFLPDYRAEYGIVISDNKYIDFKQFEIVQEAGCGDVKDIAKLMFTKKEFRQNNTIEVLEKQLYDRISSGKGRSFIIREDGMIVAHTAIYAECNNAAVESGLVVLEEYKKKMYGLIVHEYLKKLLTSENKTLFGLRYNYNMQINAQKENLNIRAECGRLIKIRE